MAYSYVKSPIGLVEVVGNKEGIIEISFVEKEIGDVRVSSNDMEEYEVAQKFAAEGVEQLEEYFAGERKKFKLPLVMKGTSFQNRVWEKLRKIGYGETITYGELAEEMGNRLAARAAGSANGKNKLAIVVPCHRVVAARGKLGGYSAGVDKKKWLLAFEKGE